MASISGSIGGNPYASFPSFTEASQKQHTILETLKQNFAIDTLVSAATQQIHAPSRSSHPNIPLMGAPQLEPIPANIASINKPQVSLAAFLNTLFNLSVLQFQLMSDENTVEESVSNNDIANLENNLTAMQNTLASQAQHLLDQIKKAQMMKLVMPLVEVAMIIIAIAVAFIPGASEAVVTAAFVVAATMTASLVITTTGVFGPNGAFAHLLEALGTSQAKAQKTAVAIGVVVQIIVAIAITALTGGTGAALAAEIALAGTLTLLASIPTVLQDAATIITEEAEETAHEIGQDKSLSAAEQAQQAANAVSSVQGTVDNLNKGAEIFGYVLLGATVLAAGVAIANAIKNALKSTSEILKTDLKAATGGLAGEESGAGKAAGSEEGEGTGAAPAASGEGTPLATPMPTLQGGISKITTPGLDEIEASLQKIGGVMSKLTEAQAQVAKLSELDEELGKQVSESLDSVEENLEELRDIVEQMKLPTTPEQLAQLKTELKTVSEKIQTEVEKTIASLEEAMKAAIKAGKPEEVIAVMGNMVKTLKELKQNADELAKTAAAIEKDEVPDTLPPPPQPATSASTTSPVKPKPSKQDTTGQKQLEDIYAKMGKDALGEDLSTAVPKEDPAITQTLKDRLNLINEQRARLAKIIEEMNAKDLPETEQAALLREFQNILKALKMNIEDALEELPADMAGTIKKNLEELQKQVGKGLQPVKSTDDVLEEAGDGASADEKEETAEEADAALKKKTEEEAKRKEERKANIIKGGRLGQTIGAAVQGATEMGQAGVAMNQAQSQYDINAAAAVLDVLSSNEDVLENYLGMATQAMQQTASNLQDWTQFVDTIYSGVFQMAGMASRS